MSGPRIFAFWKYDLFPHMLAGEVETTREPSKKQAAEAMVYVPAYQGWFKPFAILIGDAGMDLKMDLERLHEAHREERKAVDKKYRSLLSERLAAVGVTHPDLNKPGDAS